MQRAAGQPVADGHLAGSLRRVPHSKISRSATKPRGSTPKTTAAGSWGSASISNWMGVASAMPGTRLSRAVRFAGRTEADGSETFF